MVEAGRARAAVARLARRLRLHQGPRRAGAAARTAATCRCRSCGRRSSSRRSPSRCPGWIRGFRMAEPVIISYARGLLKEFPGVPEGIVDVIPVDLVVAAIIAVAAAAPTPTEPDVTQVASGLGQPAALPAPRRPRARAGSPSTRSTTPRASRSSCPSGRFPGRGRVQRQLERAKTLLERGREGRCTRCRCGASRPSWSATLEEKRDEVERALAYVELYGAYAECEAIYGVDRLLALLRVARRRATRRRSASTPGSSTGTTTSPTIHLPSVVEHARVRTDARAAAPARPARTGCAARCSTPSRHIAAFDLENTLIASNVVASLLVAGHPPPRRARTGCASCSRRCARRPRCSPLDRKDRSDFLRHFYRRYEGARVDQLDADAVEMFSDLILTKSFPAAIRRVREHRAPRPPHGAHHRRARLRRRAAAAAVRRHRLRRRSPGAPTAPTRGELTDVPPTGEARAQALIDYAEADGFDLAESVAYADSTSDLPDARGRRLPGRREPRDPPGRPRPQAGLAGRALRQGGRAPPRRCCPSAPSGAGRAAGASARSSHGATAMKALVFERKPARFAAAMVAGRLSPGRRRQGRPAARCATSTRPSCPARAGCGCARAWPASAAPTSPPSTGTSSRYFEPIVSFPFVPGHEVVGDLDDGRRVVLVPVLTCVARGIDPPCAAVRRRAHQPLRAHRASATSSPACRRGFCERTGGGWSTLHGRPRVQLVAVPDDLTDEAAVLVEPTACAVHAARAGRRRPRSPSSAPARSACSPSPPCAAPGPTSRSSPPPSTRTSSALRHASSAPTSVVAPDELDRAVRAAHRLDALDRRPAHRRRRRGRRLRRLGRVARPGPARRRAPAARSTSSACPASPPLDLTAAVAPGDRAARLLRLRRATTSTPPSSWSRDADLGRLVSRHLPPRPLRGRHRPRRQRRPPRRREDRLRPPRRNERGNHLMPRPGFVLEVDRSTPPILFHHGEGFRLEKLPAGRSRVHLPGRAARRARRPRRAPSATRCSNPLDTRAAARAAARRA